jgi:preprotein translocase subunit SecD
MKLPNLTGKIWILIIAVVLSLISVFGVPPVALQKGVLITDLDSNSTIFEAGFREGMIITAVDGQPVKNADEFIELLLDKFEQTGNESIAVTFNTKFTEIIYFSNKLPEITVSDISSSNLKFGLDLIGGSRALVQAEDKKLSQEEMRDLVDTTQNRLNEFGLTDLKVRQVSDLEGNQFMLVEIAGATQKNLESLIAQQGKFEAKIGDEIVFIGGERDIASVCRGDSTCARIENPRQSGNGYAARFSFEITLSADAAKRHAEITEKLDINSSNPQYLEKPLDLYLDDTLVDTLLISEGLKGHVTTQISVSGSGIGKTAEEAFNDAEEKMHKLQTLLITGSLPFKLEIVKLDTISPALGGEFLKIIMIAMLTAIGVVAVVVFGKYKKIKSSLALLLTSLSEVIIILGIATVIKWNLDLPSIAGILIVVGTGIDQQIIILDESRRGEFLSLKQRMKRAFAIIIGAYFTSVVAMLPLLWAGAGLLKGFAFTTIIGITVGVLITRPAFSDIIKKIEKD